MNRSVKGGTARCAAQRAFGAAARIAQRIFDPAVLVQIAGWPDQERAEFDEVLGAGEAAQRKLFRRAIEEGANLRGYGPQSLVDVAATLRAARAPSFVAPAVGDRIAFKDGIDEEQTMLVQSTCISGCCYFGDGQPIGVSADRVVRIVERADELAQAR
jgi:hypothetical protein